MFIFYHKRWFVVSTVTAVVMQLTRKNKEDPWNFSTSRKIGMTVFYFNDNKQLVMPPRTAVRGQGIFNIFKENKENVLFFKKFEDRLTKRLALLER